MHLLGIEGDNFILRVAMETRRQVVRLFCDEAFLRFSMLVIKNAHGNGIQLPRLPAATRHGNRCGDAGSRPGVFHRLPDVRVWLHGADATPRPTSSASSFHPSSSSSSEHPSRRGAKAMSHVRRTDSGGGQEVQALRGVSGRPIGASKLPFHAGRRDSASDANEERNDRVAALSFPLAVWFPLCVAGRFWGKSRGPFIWSGPRGRRWGSGAGIGFLFAGVCRLYFYVS